MQRSSESDELIAVGIISRTVGLDGLCGIEPAGFALETLDLPCKVLVGESEKQCSEITLDHLEVRPKNLVGLFAGVDSVDAAEVLKGKNIYIRKADLPELGEDEFYHFELLGMTVLTDTGSEPVGSVIAVHNFPSADTIEISRKRGDSLLIPLTGESVVRIDKDSRRIILNFAFVEELLL